MYILLVYILAFINKLFLLSKVRRIFLDASIGHAIDISVVKLVILKKDLVSLMPNRGIKFNTTDLHRNRPPCPCKKNASFVYNAAGVPYLHCHKLHYY